MPLGAGDLSGGISWGGQARLQALQASRQKTRLPAKGVEQGKQVCAKHFRICATTGNGFLSTETRLRLDEGIWTQLLRKLPGIAPAPGVSPDPSPKQHSQDCAANAHTAYLPRILETLMQAEENCAFGGSRQPFRPSEDGPLIAISCRCTSAGQQRVLKRWILQPKRLCPGLVRQESWKL